MNSPSPPMTLEEAFGRKGRSLPADDPAQLGACRRVYEEIGTIHLKILHDPRVADQADDIRHDVWIKVVQKGPQRLEKSGSERAYLAAALRNAAITVIRNSGTEVIADDDMENIVDRSAGPDQLPAGEANAEAEDASGRLDAELGAWTILVDALKRVLPRREQLDCLIDAAARKAHYRTDRAAPFHGSLQFHQHTLALAEANALIARNPALSSGMQAQVAVLVDQVLRNLREADQQQGGECARFQEALAELRQRLSPDRQPEFDSMVRLAIGLIDYASLARNGSVTPVALWVRHNRLRNRLTRLAGDHAYLNSVVAALKVRHAPEQGNEHDTSSRLEK